MWVRTMHDVFTSHDDMPVMHTLSHHVTSYSLLLMNKSQRIERIERIDVLSVTV